MFDLKLTLSVIIFLSADKYKEERICLIQSQK